MRVVVREQPFLWSTQLEWLDFVLLAAFVFSCGNRRSQTYMYSARYLGNIPSPHPQHTPTLFTCKRHLRSCLFMYGSVRLVSSLHAVTDWIQVQVSCGRTRVQCLIPFAAAGEVQDLGVETDYPSEFDLILPARQTFWSCRPEWHDTLTHYMYVSCILCSSSRYVQTYLPTYNLRNKARYGRWTTTSFISHQLPTSNVLRSSLLASQTFQVHPLSAH